MTTIAIRLEQHEKAFNAYTRGTSDFLHGLKIHECPYPARTLEGDSWELAWGRTQKITTTPRTSNQTQLDIIISQLESWKPPSQNHFIDPITLSELNDIIIKLQQLQTTPPQIQIIDSYQYPSYEKLMDKVNTFCNTHIIIEIKSDIKKDNITYSIIYQ